MRRASRLLVFTEKRWSLNLVVKILCLTTRNTDCQISAVRLSFTQDSHQPDPVLLMQGQCFELF